MKKILSLWLKKNISASAGVFSLLLLLFFCSGCASFSAPQLYNVHWRPTGQAPEKVFLLFTPDKRRVVGCCGSNNFFGPVKIEKDKISVGMLGATRMATPHGAYERKFLEDLRAAKRLRFESDGSLTLLDVDGTPCMHLRAVPQPVVKKVKK